MKQLFTTLSFSILFLLSANAQPSAEFNWLAECSQISFTDLSTCNGCNIVSWEWDFGDGVISNLQNPVHWYSAPGTYMVTLEVQDIQGNTSSISHDVTPNNGNLQIAFNVTPESFCFTCDGIIEPIVTGGTPPYTFLWSNGQTTGSVFGACAGPYEVSVTDANGCLITDVVTLGSQGGATIELDTLVHVNCVQNGGLGMIEVHGQNGSGQYYYSWFHNGIIVSDSSALIDITEGDYTLIISDSTGCGESETFTITNTSNLYVSTQSYASNCGNNGSAWVTVQGDYPPYTYLWNDPLTQPTDTAHWLASGTYEVQVMDSIGCLVTGNISVANGCYNMIEGTVYLDSNQNCIQDQGEPGVSSALMYAPGSYGLTDNNGHFSVHTQQMNTSVSTLLNSNPLLSNTCPASGSQNVSFTQLGDTSVNNDFGVYLDVNGFDLAISPWGSGAPPGFNKTYGILFKNYSYQHIDAIIRFEYDPVLTFLSTTLGGVHDPQNNVIEWQMDSLAPTVWWSSSNQSPRAFFNVPTSVQLGDTLCGYFEILPIVGDIDSTNNRVTLCQIVTGSYDPNDKQVNPLGTGEEGYILPQDTVFSYRIRFQNTGTDTAFTVVIKDTLSPLLNPATLVLGGSSHHYIASLSGDGLLTFRFDEIFLPDSNVNEPASHGFVNYTIKADADLPLGSVIENTAAIYFDFNEPVITNTTVNTIHDPLKVEQIVDDSEFEIYPNPTHNMVNLISTKPLLQAWLTDLAGRRIIPLQGTGTFWQGDLSALPRGAFLVDAITEDGVRAVKKVIKE